MIEIECSSKNRYFSSKTSRKYQFQAKSNYYIHSKSPFIFVKTTKYPFFTLKSLVFYLEFLAESGQKGSKGALNIINI